MSVGSSGAASVLPTCLLALCLSACGSARPRAASGLCYPRVRQLVARALAVSPSRVSATRGIGNNGSPQCSFSAHLAGGGKLELTVNVDTGPQPYMILSRTIVEGQQVFSPTRLVPAPVAVNGLGLLASWFPNYSWLMSTDGARLITTTVLWPHTTQAQKIRFATRISRLYIGKSQPAKAKLYP